MRPRLLTAALAAAALALPAAAQAAPQRICTETLVRMDDGVRLHAWVSRLAPDGPRPVLFMMDSYSRGGKPGKSPASDNDCPQSLPDDYVPAYLPTSITDRFTLVQVAYRGTGSSEGLFDFTGPRTQKDISAAVDWAAHQPWSTGAITLTGESGAGFYAFHALAEPAVKAALIFTSCADMYRCLYRGGEYDNLAAVYLEATTTGYTAGLDARNRLGTAANPPAPLQLGALAAAATDSLTHSSFDGFWTARSALAKLAAVRKPVMYTTDLYDIVQPFDALQLTPGARFNFGMGHLSAPVVAAGGARYQRLVREPVARFVAHYGLGDRNGAQRDPRVTLVTNLGSAGEFDKGHVLARAEKAWPLPGTRFTKLFLGAGGRLQTAAPATAGPADSALMVPAPALDMRSVKLLAGSLQPSDLRNDERSGLTYTTPVLQRDLELTGPVSLRVWATSTAPNFDWSVRLTDVWPDGRSEWITDGYERATLRKVDDARSLHDAGGEVVRPWLTYDAPQSVPLGEAVPYAIDLIGTSNVFRKGHRVRLDILPLGRGQIDSPFTLGLGVLGVLHDPAHPSALMVPVIPDRCGRGRALVPRVGRPRSCARSYAAALVRPA